MKSIFEYSDPNAYLQDRWADIKGKNPHFSIRSWAQHLDMGAHAPLHQMILGKRKITHSYIPKMIKYFQLSEKESLYFELLVKFSRAQTTEETNFYLETIKELKPKKSESSIVISDYEVQKNPLHFFIMELAELTDLPNDYQIVKAKLAINYTSFEVKSAVQLLINAGYLQANEDNLLVKTHRHLYSNQDKKDMALVQYHQKLCSLAHSAVGTQDVSEREFNGTSFNINRSKMSEMKEEMRAFLQQMILKYEQPAKNGDSTYQLNIHFFKVAEK